MVKATLRTKPSTKPPVTVEVESKVVSVSSPEPSQTVDAGAGAATQDLTSLLPSDRATAPPVDNAHVAEGCEKFDAPATRPARSQPAAVDGFTGDWGGDDVKFPQLKLVQGSGPLSQTNDAGTILYGEDVLFLPASVREGAVAQVIRFVPISITKQYREKLSQDQVQEGLMPRIVSSMDEVHELGGTTQWGSGPTPPDNYWEPSARCIFLIEQPEGSEHPGFALELDGKLYGVAVYYAAGGAYRASAKVIYNTARTSLLVPVLDAAGKPVTTEAGRPVKKPLIYKNFWGLSFGKVKAGNFTPWRPSVKLLKEQTGPDALAYCASLVQNAEQAKAASEASE